MLLVILPGYGELKREIAMFLLNSGRKLGDWLLREEGSASAEAVIWMPVFAIIIAIVGDTSLVFLRQAEAIRVVQNANRQLAIGLLVDEVATDKYIHNGLVNISPNAIVVTQIINGIITTKVQMPASDLTATGFFAALDGVTVDFSAEFLSEI